MNYASIGIRAVEGLIDLVVSFVILWIVAVLSGETLAGGFQLVGAPAFLGYLLVFAYFLVMEALIGATVGKLMLKLRVVKEADGSPIDWRASAVRNVLRIVDGFAFYLVGFLIICFTQKHQRLGDKVAGTVVVRRA